MICNSYNAYFEEKFLEVTDEEYTSLSSQYSQLVNSINKSESINKRKLLSAIMESKTKYRLCDYVEDANSASIYSPRIDVAFTPILSDNRNLAFYHFETHQDFMANVSQLSFIKDMITEYKTASKKNYDFCKKECNFRQSSIVRPMYIFGIEIEKQRGKKYLFGDIINAASLSLIPIVLVPKGNISEIKDILEYCRLTYKVKEFNLFQLISRCLFLTDEQFCDISNKLFDKVNSGISHITQSIYD